MSANIIRLLPDEERALLQCYVAGSQHPPSFQQLFDTMEVPGLTTMATKRKRPPNNDPPPLSEEHQRHQQLFKERRRWVGFGRWMASRYRGIVPTTPGKPHKQLES